MSIEVTKETTRNARHAQLLIDARLTAFGSAASAAERSESAAAAGLALWFWNLEIPTDLASQVIVDFAVTRNG